MQKGRFRPGTSPASSVSPSPFASTAMKSWAGLPGLTSAASTRSRHTCGTQPVKALFAKRVLVSRLREDKLGTAPVKRLLFRFRTCRARRLSSESGISPVNWLPHRDNWYKPVRLPSDSGISPVNWFWFRYRYLRPVRRLRLGIEPVNWFWLRVRSCMAVRLPSETGIAPVNWLPCRYSTCKAVRLLKSRDSPRQPVPLQVQVRQLDAAAQVGDSPRQLVIAQGTDSSRR